MIDPEAMTVAKAVARELVHQGAEAVVMAGSFVRGEAARESDVDLYALGTETDYQLIRRGGFLVSISYRTLDTVRASFRDPSQVGSVIPGWREAAIVEDPEGLALELKAEAERWTWDVVGTESCNRAVAEAVVGLAEEVHKLVVSRDAGRPWVAAVQRNVLAARLAFPMSVQLRILYGSENRLWELVASRMDEPWKQAQIRAFGISRCTFEDSCAAALELYWLAATVVWDLLSREQREVVRHGCRIAGFELVGRHG